jgi:heparin binding hemagglutinin HbhA
MTEQTPNTKIPAPLYAAAGAGDLAYQQLRKLPAVLDELAGRVNEFSGQSGTKAAQLRDKAAQLRDKAGTADLDKIRDNAAASAIAFATTATERAVAAYTALVARGERVVGTGVIEAAEVVNADMVTTEEPKAVESAAAATEPEPRKRAATTTAKAAPAKRTAK